MTGVRLPVDLSELAAGRDIIARVLASAEDTEPLMDEIGAAMVAWTDLHFEKEEDPDGRKWTPLAPATLEARRRRGSEHPAILQDSARLRGSFTHEASRTRAEAGTNLIYAAIHQGGGQAGRGRKVTIPARAFMGFSGDDLEEMGEMAADFLAGIVNGEMQ